MNLDPSTIITGFTNGAVAYIKIALLILLGLYAVFTLMLSVKIRSLNRTVFLPAESGEVVLRIFAILYLLAVLSLFIATIVIV
ncbi:MAG TPA: DUF5657 family protein [Candidatus Acidoferrales bacterium]|nr:DUF5657 family protein [Candidatus Acidoferrales bacterium]